MFRVLSGYVSLKEICLVRAQALLSRLKTSLIRRARIGSPAVQVPDAAMGEKLRRAREKIAEKNEELEEVRRQMVVKNRELAKLRASAGVETRTGGIRPENIIWVFGT